MQPATSHTLCVVTLYRKTISCVAFSPGGKFLAAGECGHQPCIRVWDVASKTILSELQGHTFGVACVVRQQCGVHTCTSVWVWVWVHMRIVTHDTHCVHEA